MRLASCRQRCSAVRRRHAPGCDLLKAGDLIRLNRCASALYKPGELAILRHGIDVLPAFHRRVEHANAVKLLAQQGLLKLPLLSFRFVGVRGLLPNVLRLFVWCAVLFNLPPELL